MTILVQKSPCSYHVCVGEVIDHTYSSRKQVSDLLWEGVNKYGQNQFFKTKAEAMNYAAR